MRQVKFSSTAAIYTSITNNIDLSYFAGYEPTKITFGVSERLRCQETDLLLYLYARFLEILGLPVAIASDASAVLLDLVFFTENDIKTDKMFFPFMKPSV